MGFPLNLSNITMVGVYFVCFFSQEITAFFITKCIYKEFVMYLMGPLEEGKWPRVL